MNINKQVVIITGGSKGIGKGLALALAAQGARLLLTARGEEALAETARAAEEKGAEVLTLQADVRSPEDAEKTIGLAMEKWGRIDVLINNAGYGRRISVEEMSVEQWDDMFATNCRGPFLLTRLVAPIMRRQKQGTFVNISSLAGKNPVPDMPCYAATKWALDGFSKSLMQVLRKDNIRMILVHPGSTLTHFSDNPEKDDMAERILTIQDVADMVTQALRLPGTAMVSEIDLRPTNP